MSILIKGMKMPKNCGECPFKGLSPTGESMICDLTLFNVPWEWIPFDCPLIELPEKHGRLIDADALLKKFCGHCDGYEECGTNKIRVECYDLGLINHSPTIIEAEGTE